MGDIDVKNLIDLGTSGVLLFLLIMVWRRLNVVTDILIAQREETRQMREFLVKRPDEIGGDKSVLH